MIVSSTEPLKPFSIPWFQQFNTRVRGKGKLFHIWTQGSIALPLMMQSDGFLVKDAQTGKPNNFIGRSDINSKSGLASATARRAYKRALLSSMLGVHQSGSAVLQPVYHGRCITLPSTFEKPLILLLTTFYYSLASRVHERYCLL